MMPVQNRDTLTIEEQIKARALSLGFLSCGITSPEPMQSFPLFQQWLSKGYHAGMKYLATPYHLASRRDPHSIMENVQSIICLAFRYPLHPLSALNERDKALIAGYSTGIDYHLQLSNLMDSLIASIRSLAGENIGASRYADSAPILERELARRAGLGWIGKNSCIMSPEHGSSFLLAEIFLDLALTPDPPFDRDLCGTCHRCIDACPTGCINQDRTLDAAKCISYHTIENKEAIPSEIAGRMGNWLFGCDVCQMVCPWNQKVNGDSQPVAPLSFSVQEVASILTSSQADFEKRFNQSSILRSKWKGFKRNILIVLSSSTPETALPVLHKFKHSNHDDELSPLVDWSIERLTKNPPV